MYLYLIFFGWCFIHLSLEVSNKRRSEFTFDIFLCTSCVKKAFFANSQGIYIVFGIEVGLHMGNVLAVQNKSSYLSAAIE